MDRRSRGTYSENPQGMKDRPGGGEIKPETARMMDGSILAGYEMLDGWVIGYACQHEETEGRRRKRRRENDGGPGR